MYVNLVHRNWDRDYTQTTASQLASKRLAHEKRGDIPIEVFRAAVRKLKDQKHTTWDVLALVGGVSEGQLKVWMYGKGREWVERESATNFLRRLAGLSAPPSKHQMTTGAKHVRKVDQTIAQMGYDAKRTLNNEQRYLRWG